MDVRAAVAFEAGKPLAVMTLDVDEMRNLGPALGVHPVSRVWREADFRISFAKNKTHSYAYYTLTLKNIYGALPLANKFKEYHCSRDIYATAIEYLRVAGAVITGTETVLFQLLKVAGTDAFKKISQRIK